MKFKILAIYLFIFAYPVYSVDMQALLKETQRMNFDNNNIKLIWWMPSEYWSEILKDDKTMTQEQLDKFVSKLENYNILAIVNGKMNITGSMNFQKYNEIVQETIIKIDDIEYRALDKNTIDPKVITFFNIMKPMLASMLGQFGMGIEYIFFTGKNDMGYRLANPEKEGDFYINYRGSYRYRLPLGALMPDKFDLETKEKFPGNYKYNPYTGGKLD